MEGKSKKMEKCTDKNGFFFFFPKTALIFTSVLLILTKEKEKFDFPPRKYHPVRDATSEEREHQIFPAEFMLLHFHHSLVCVVQATKIKPVPKHNSH